MDIILKRVIKIINSSLIYITDWFSTLLDLAGLKHRIPATVDSLSMKRTLLQGKRSRRREIVLNLDRDEDQGLWSAAILRGGHKLIWGQARLLKQKVTTTTLKYLDKIQQVCLSARCPRMLTM